MGMPTHLSAADIQEFGREMDAIRNEVMQSRGESDRQYILGIIKLQRTLALAGRSTGARAPSSTRSRPGERIAARSSTLNSSRALPGQA